MSAIGVVTACGSSRASERGDPAVWYVAGDQGLRPSSTTFRVTVTRTGCSSGQQGTPLAPVIDTSDDAVTITFRIDPHISSGTCEGTAGVGYLVRLGEPIGKRALVDGGCESVSGLSSTVFCVPDGVRVRWRHRELRVVGGSP
jgi:hypothetical protein